MKILEMRKDIKIKYSVSSPLYKILGNFFRKKDLYGEQTFLENLWVMFYMGTNDQIIQGVKLMVKRFQRSSQVSFLLIDPDLGY